MCTATWIREKDHHTLWFTRDERRDRTVAEGPSLRRVNEVEFLSPRDPDSGGTWIGVNEFGLTVALANANPKFPEPDRPLSRGPLVWELLQAGSRDAAVTRVDRSALHQIRPFILMLIEPGQSAHLARWDGRHIRHELREESGVLMATSSLGEDAGVARRNQIIAASGGVFTPEFVERIHGDPTAPGASGVSVARPEVATVSLTKLRVGRSKAEMIYTPGPPSRTEPDAAQNILFSTWKYAQG